MDSDQFWRSDAASPSYCSFSRLNAEEGIGTQWHDISAETEYPPQGQVKYPFYDNDATIISAGLTKKFASGPFIGEPLFPYLIERKDNLEIRSRLSAAKWN